ncbi:MAG: efflux RND transporter periplasmic adaptor subunit [Gammaproteobacteria bacterium]
MSTHRFVLLFLLMISIIPAPANASDAVSAQVQEVKPQPIKIYAAYPGTVMPTEYVQVASRMSGYVENIRVHEGESVKKGELLLKVNPTEVAAGVSQARAQVAKARAALATAKENYKRFKNLYAEQAIPKQRFEQVELAYTAAKNDYKAAQAGLRQAMNQVKYADVRAPFNGIIFSKKVSNGQLVGPGQVLMVFYNPGQLEVDVQVDDLAYYQLKLGEHVPVQFSGPNREPQQTEATVQTMVVASDPHTHTHTVKLLLPAASKVDGGAYARVMIPVQTQQAILIPRSAVQVRAGITGVFVVGPDSNAVFRMVTLGERRGDKVVVLSGLSDGDHLIVSARGELYNGTKIEAAAGNAS